MLQPLSNHVLLEAVEEKTTKSGIVIPDNVDKDGPVPAKVIAVGPGKMDEDGEKRIPLAVKVGDMVLAKKGYPVKEIKLDGKEYLLAEEDDILGIIQ